MTPDQIRHRAINVIEGIGILWENGPKSLKRAEQLLDAVYRYAHLANGTCNNLHADWLIELNTLYDELIKYGIINRDEDDVGASG